MNAEVTIIYISMPITVLDKCSDRIPFSVFIKLGNDKYVQIFSPEAGLDKLRVAKYKTKISTIYIKNTDKTIFEEYIKATNITLEPDEVIKVDTPKAADPNMEDKKKAIISSLEKATQANLEKVMLPTGVPDEEIEETKTIVKTYVNILSRDPDVVFNILKNINESDYLTYHLTATSMLSIFICRLLKQYGTRLKEIVGLGGYLHDIGKMKIMLEHGIDIANYDDQIIPSAKLRVHPKAGLDMVSKSKSVPEEVKQIIYQHHESPDGTGYPLGVKGSRIYFPATVVSIADTFSHLVSPAPYGKALSPRDSIRKMLDMEGRFNKHIIRPLTVLYKV